MKIYLEISKLFFMVVFPFVSRLPILWRGAEGREPERIRAGGGPEAGGHGAGCGSHVRAGGGRRMRDIKFLMTF